MNEGHAGFLGVERIRELVTDGGLDFDTALAVVRSSTVFTTHTPVPGGHRPVPVDMVRHYFGGRPKLTGCECADCCPESRWTACLAFGAEDDPSKFNMAHMGLRLAQRANGVSLLHGQVSRGMFNELWPGFDHRRGADRLDHQRRARADLGGAAVGGTRSRAARPDDLGSLSEPETWQRLQQVDPGHLWWIRSQLRELLIDDVRARLRRSWLERGASDAELGWIADGVRSRTC